MANLRKKKVIRKKNIGLIRLSVFLLTMIIALTPVFQVAGNSEEKTYAEAFPNGTFRQLTLEYLNADGGNRTAASILTTQDQAILAARSEMALSYRNITDFTGLEYYTGLITLICNNNAMTTLDVSASTKLEELYCYNGTNLTTLNVSGAVNLKKISAWNCKLTALDVTNNTRLVELELSTNGLQALNVANNPALEVLNFGYNQLSAIDLSSNPELKSFWCFSNNLASLDVSKNTKLETMECWGNPITTLNLSNNPALTYLHTGGNPLGTLDVTKCPALKDLRCAGNQLTQLNLSANPELENLWCFDNALTSLDITANTKLKEIRCFRTQLTTLDLSKNVDLEELRCYEARFTTLDVSHNLNLKELYCEENQLTTLDVSKNAELLVVSFKDNLISSIDVSKNPKLGFLWFEGNLLTEIDISNNPQLKQLFCQSNKLTTLDVTKNPLLEWLHCYNNGLTELNVTQNTLMTRLYCQDNRLKELDISKNTALTWVQCQGNELRTLNVTNNPVLNTIYCNDNFMTSPDDVIGWRTLGLTINSPQSLVSGNFRYYNQKAQATPGITITLQPENSVVAIQDDVVTVAGYLSIAATVPGGAAPAYSWFQCAGTTPNPAVDEIVGVGNILDLVYLFVPTYYNGHYNFYCVVSAPGYEAVTSNVVTARYDIIVSDPFVQIITQPVRTTVTTEGLIKESLFIEAIGGRNGQIYYQWYRNTVDSNTGGTLIPGAVSSTFTIPTTLTASASPYYYYCIADVGFMREESQVAIVIVNTPQTGAPITSIRIDAASSVTLARNTTYRYKVLLNQGASSEGIVWSISNQAFATVNSSGVVTTKNLVGAVQLTATDPISGLRHVIVIRIQ